MLNDKSLTQNQYSEILALQASNSVGRSLSERFVREVFADAYGAKVYSFLENMLCLTKDDEIEGLIAFSSSDQKFWLEDYLDHSVDDLLYTLHNISLDRSKIAEVGNLASKNCGGNGRVLVFAMTELLLEAGFEWAVFTSTYSLRLFFRRLRVTYLSLGHAELSKLNDSRSYWGSYYENRPEVITVNLQELHEIFISLKAFENWQELLKASRSLGADFRAVLV